MGIIQGVAFDVIYFKPKKKKKSNVSMLLIVVIYGLCGVFASTRDVEIVTRLNYMSV